ncbi:MAG TPA: hypothetical protein VI790_05350 [Candidatus Nanoarchaeia archaeon]|nr:hypothetical protein [Candidatus Nanoarchaeia archaeon]
MSNRPNVELGGSSVDLISTMSEGNPSALRVLMQIIQKNPLEGMMDVLYLDDMNIRSTQIWYGYKKFCNQNLNLYVDKIRARDPEMVEYINECAREDCSGNQVPIAVTSGGSYGARPYETL